MLRVSVSDFTCNILNYVVMLLFFNLSMPLIIDVSCIEYATWMTVLINSYLPGHGPAWCVRDPKSTHS